MVEELLSCAFHAGCELVDVAVDGGVGDLGAGRDGVCYGSCFAALSAFSGGFAFPV